MTIPDAWVLGADSTVLELCYMHRLFHEKDKCPEHSIGSRSFAGESALLMRRKGCTHHHPESPGG